MDAITLKRINKRNNTISFDFNVTDGLNRFFTDKPFEIEYPENIESVPDSVAAIPFVCNVLPIIWLTNSTLRLPALDKDFFECIPDVKKGYQNMFPESTFAGELEIGEIVEFPTPEANKSASFFSGGLDATDTLIRHIDEKPMLLSIWGSDVRIDNVDGWEKTLNGIKKSANKFGLVPYVIRSSFREFDNEAVLHNTFSEQLKDSWWHGVKHGLALLCHAAPVAYLHGLTKIYIASSFCPEDGNVRCASYPTIDNFVKFAGAKISHDGFECNRQDKIFNVVKYVESTGNNVSLHVCWQTETGTNCCRCEKCYRTLAGLLAEGADPTDYGFENFSEGLPFMREYLIEYFPSRYRLRTRWSHISKRVCENKQMLSQKPYWQYISWLAKADFSNPEKLKMPLFFRIRRKLSSFKFYRKLHEIKSKILKESK